jgi:hypothetical protein
VIAQQQGRIAGVFGAVGRLAQGIWGAGVLGENAEAEWTLDVGVCHHHLNTTRTAVVASRRGILR